MSSVKGSTACWPEQIFRMKYDFSTTLIRDILQGNNHTFAVFIMNFEHNAQKKTLKRSFFHMASLMHFYFPGLCEG